MAKGIELPINILVIIAVAVIVLLAVVALFIIGFKPSSNISAESAFSEGCRTVVYNCGIDLTTITTSFTEPGKTSADNMRALCIYLGKGSGDVTCRTACGCP
jgi:hypothetical protein